MGLSTFDTLKHVDADEGMVEVSGERLGALQRVLAMMLRDVDRVCRENKIEYTLGGGACLGAVRHKGFIPWDDDVDINMTREGYRRFAEVFPEALGDRYWLHDCERTPGYDLAFPRVRLKGTVVRSRDDLGSDECGAYIDIFLIENAPSGKVGRAVHGLGSMVLGLAYSCRRFAARADEYLALAGGNAEARSVFKKKIAIGRLLSFKSAVGWTQVWDCWNARCRDEDSDYVAIPVGRRHYFGETYPRDSYFPVSYGEFEGMEAPLPANSDSYMRALYGSDYMTPPDVPDREKHVVYEFDLGKYDEI